MAKLTTKDFTEIGEMLANLKSVEGEVSAKWMRNQVVLNLSYILSKTNEKFDADKFFTLADNTANKSYPFRG